MSKNKPPRRSDSTEERIVRLERAEQESARRAALERLVAGIATEMVRVHDHELDEHIGRAVEQIGRFVDADRCYVFAYVSSQKEANNIHEWCKEDVTPQREHRQGLKLENFPWMKAEFARTDYVEIPCVGELPEDAHAERTVLEQQQIRSLLLVPIRAPRVLLGAIGFDAVTKEHPWQQEDLELLKVVSGVLAAAMQRQQANEKLMESESRRRSILEAIPDFVFAFSPEGIILDVHVPPSKSLPVPVERLMGYRVQKLLPERTANRVMDQIKLTAETGVIQTAQYVLPISNQDPRFFEVRFAPHEGKRVFAIVRDITGQKQAELRLREQENIYRILMLSTTDAIVLTDGEGRIVSVNPGVTRIFGYEESELTGQPLSKLLPGNLRSQHLPEVEALLLGDQSGLVDQIVERYGVRKDRKQILVEMTISAWRSSGKIRFANVIRDITERRRAETRLKESEQRLAQLFQHLADMVLVHDEHGNFIDANPKVTEVLGYGRDELLTMDVSNIDQAQDAERLRQTWKTMGPAETIAVEGLYQKKDGTQIPVEIRMAKFTWVDSRAVVLAIARDITERKRNETVMLEHQRQLRQLASRLTLTEEEQRRTLALELHDGLGQELAIARLRLQTYQSQDTDKRNSQHLMLASSLVQKAMDRVHSLTFDLSPPALHELGLPSALRSLGRRIEAEHSIVFHYDESGEPVALPKDIQVLLFRTVRELTFNVVKHAEASTLRVHLHMGDRHAHITVSDDGVGISDEAVRRASEPGENNRFGLFSVQERLRSVQGTLQLQRKEGTIAMIVVPIHPPIESDDPQKQTP